MGHYSGSISGEKLNFPADPLCRRFTFAEIRTTTENFSDGFVIGRGGFGKVFKGIIDNGATTVAIKRLDPMSNQGSKEFLTEIEMLSKCRHSHVVSLIGYCDDNDEMILVYEYVKNGSLANHLYKEKATNANNSTMSWVKRVKICLAAARGLDYLHTGVGFVQKIIHRDVKSSNILLDENWAAKISDFGLSKFGPANQSLTHISTDVKGTRGYCDPDYFWTHRLTRKSDVYSFGVVLLEVLCGRRVLDSELPKEQRNLVLWAKQCIQEDKIHVLKDPKIEGEIFDNSLKAFVKIAGQCLDSRKKRPTMSEVVASLEDALALQEKKGFSSNSALLMPKSEGNEKASLGEDALEEGPGMEGFQITGEAKLGGKLLGWGNHTRGTTVCLFKWVHYLGDNSKKYIEGATSPEYLVTAADVGKLLALECIPMDDQGRQGKLLVTVANNLRQISCEQYMQQQIDRYISKGHVSFDVLSLTDSRYKEGKPATLVLRKFHRDFFYIITPKTYLIAEKLSEESIKIPLGSSTLFDITSSNGSSESFKTYGDDGSRDKLVLTLRTFIAKALERKRKRTIFHYFIPFI